MWHRTRAQWAQPYPRRLHGHRSGSSRLRHELEKAGIDTGALLEDATRATTTKTRITAAGQQIVRFDEEDRSPLARDVANQLICRCEAYLDAVDVCVISDYAKGVVTDFFSRSIIAAARQRGLPVVVDPKSRDLARYRGATVITPNLKETTEAAGSHFDAAPDLAYTAGILLRLIAPSALLVTRGEDGMSLFEDGQGERRLPALLNEVADVTGAGDTVVGALAIALGMGLDLPRAAAIANIAAGVAVSHAGTWAVRAEELLDAGARLPERKDAESAGAC